MKILFLTRLYKPHVGGVEKHVEKVSNELIKRGHQITVVTEKHSKELKSSENIDGIKVVRIEYPKKKIIGLLGIWMWMINNRSLFKNSDIIHVHDVMIWYLPLRFLYYKKPTYITMHGWEGKFPIPRRYKFLKKLSWRLSWKTMIVGEFIRKYYNINAEELTYGATKAPKRTKGKDNSIVYIGRLDKDTGIENFLKALVSLRKYDIHFCGDGDLRKECGLLGEVHGFVDPEPFLSKASVVYASGYLSILESFANKCLTLSSYTNQLRKDYLLMTPFSNWIVVENEPGKMTKAIKMHFENPTQNKAIINAYNWAKNESWEKLTNSYIKMWGFK